MAKKKAPAKKVDDVQSREARAARIAKYKWKKGQSGNPKGKPKSLPKLETLLREVLGGYDPEGGDSPLKKILENMLHQATLKHNVHASKTATLLIERAYGKAPIIIKTEGDGTLPKTITGFNVTLKTNKDDDTSSTH